MLGTASKHLIENIRAIVERCVWGHEPAKNNDLCFVPMKEAVMEA